jgi:predicted Fe-Mo cluster-binding NifX family protein
MKILITTTSPGLESPIDPRFGRCAYLTVVDADTLECQSHPNPGVNAAGGAGTQTAQFAAARNATVVISGNYGPNAFQVLHAAGIAMYLCAEDCTARDALAYFAAGRLQLAGAPTRAGHHA